MNEGDLKKLAMSFGIDANTVERAAGQIKARLDSKDDVSHLRAPDFPSAHERSRPDQRSENDGTANSTLSTVRANTAEPLQVKGLLNDQSAVSAKAYTFHELDVKIEEQYRHLREYSDQADKEALVDKVKYWTLKIPAIVASALAGIFGALHLDIAVIVSACVGTLAATIDSIYPRGMLHNVHRRAANDLALFASKIRTEWQAACVQCDRSPDQLKPIFAKALTDANGERERVQTYVTAAEASLDAKPR